jgi:hypothetical protein
VARTTIRHTYTPPHLVIGARRAVERKSRFSRRTA